VRVGKGGTFMVGPGRHLPSLRHWCRLTIKEILKTSLFEFHVAMIKNKHIFLNQMCNQYVFHKHV